MQQNPVLEHLPLDTDESFFAKAFDLPYFGTPWHFHPEFELVLVEKSQGKRFVGNSVSDFMDGDLSLFGPNLPHLYKNPQHYYEKNSNLRAHSIVIHFLEESIGKDFLALPQSKKIKSLLELSQQGIDILGETRNIVVKKMRILLEAHGIDRLIMLIQILNLLADTKEYKVISAPGIIGHNKLDTDRLDKIFQYILKNYHREIELEEVANLINMTRTSFCRFFKERTKRNFSSFLMDIRLDNAAKLLSTTTKSVSDVSFCCGYNNLSNFNRQFKDKFKTPPRQYRNSYEVITSNT